MRPDRLVSPEPDPVPTENTEEVGSVLFHGPAIVVAAAVRSRLMTLVAPSEAWYTAQSVPAVLRDFTIIMRGATPSPWPIVEFTLVPEYVSTLNPAVVFADTVLVIEPEVFVTAGVPFARHCQPTKVAAFWFVEVLVPNVKPLAFNEVILVESVTSAFVKLENSAADSPLTESIKMWSLDALRDLVHTKSG